MEGVCIQRDSDSVGEVRTPTEMQKKGQKASLGHPVPSAAPEQGHEFVWSWKFFIASKAVFNPNTNK